MLLTESPKYQKLARYAGIFLLGFALALTIVTASTRSSKKLCDSSKYTIGREYTSLNIACDVQDEVSSNYDPDMKGDVQNYIDDVTTRKTVSDIAVYYFNFSDKSWFSINENEKFYPTSLLKVPLLLAALKENELNPYFLSELIKYKGTASQADQFYPPPVKLETGKAYYVKDLAEIMIKYSNNEAATIIADLLGPDKIKSVYHEMGIGVPSDLLDDKFISVRQYMSFYKVLFYASYISRTASGYALDLLSHTTFNDGIIAGLPEGIVTSHKFGERTDPVTHKNYLHDCGIVYIPGKPYLLCVMTVGSDFPKLAGIIKNISHVVYNDVTSN